MEKKISVVFCFKSIFAAHYKFYGKFGTFVDLHPVTYLYESESYWDKDKGQPRNKRVCIGKIDLESGETIYNQRYLESHKPVVVFDEF